MQPLHVLVVEDDAMIGAVLAEMLTEMGHAVDGIESTEATAIAAAYRLKPHLMIVDVGLVEGSGVAAMEAILRVGPQPHVFMSGDVSKVRVLRPGAVTLQKPFREPDLVNAWVVSDAYRRRDPAPTVQGIGPTGPRITEQREIP